MSIRGQKESNWRHIPEENILQIEGLSKSYEDEEAVRDLSLDVGRGELLTLLGPSGCGKTTTLRLIAGLEKPDSGVIRIDGETVCSDDVFVEPENRDVGLVFQEFALFPHLSVEENIGYGLRETDMGDSRLDEMLELVGLEEHKDKKPDQLSGGQRQRVALARSLAPEPDILLLDEPFSNLDVGLRVRMREEVRSILKEAGVTAISVTHDQEEALSISDRIGVMQAGSVVQVGSPEEVFQHPESRFVAEFLGNACFLSSKVLDGVVSTPLGEIDIEMVAGLTDQYSGAEIDVLVRPDDLKARSCGDASVADGEIVYRKYDGPSFIYRVKLRNGDSVGCMHNHVDNFEVGEMVQIELNPDHELAWYPSGDE